MSRIKIELPEPFHFIASIPVRITDVNYGGHVGNDAIVSIVHEARMQFFKQFDYEELNFAGVALIMSDLHIEYKRELFYGDTLSVAVKAANFSRISFDIFYKLQKYNSDAHTIIAVARTGMVSYNYSQHKVVALPAEGANRLK